MGRQVRAGDVARRAPRADDRAVSLRMESPQNSDLEPPPLYLREYEQVVNQWPFGPRLGYRRKCPHCGEDFWKVYTYNSSASHWYREHWLASPKCWEADQRLLKDLRDSDDHMLQALLRDRIKVLRCLDCRRVFYGRWPSELCIYCRKQDRADQQRERRECYNHATKIPKCVVCGRQLALKRTNAKTCSPKCRQKLYRSNQSPK